MKRPSGTFTGGWSAKENQMQKAQSPLSTRRALRYLFFLIVFGLAVHLILPQIASLEKSIQVIKGMIIWAVILAIGAQIASYLGSGYLLKTLVRLTGGSLTIMNGTIMTLAGASLGMVAGGVVGTSAAIYRWMQKENIRPAAATLSGTIPALFNNIVLVAASLVGLVHLLAVHQLSREQGVSFTLLLFILVMLVGLLLWGLRRRNALTRLADRAGRRWATFRRREYQPQKVDAGLSALFNASDLLLSGGWRGPMIGALLNVAFDMLTLYFLFIAAGHPIGLGVLLTGYGLPLLLGKLAFMIPGGVGVVETTMAGIYTSLGVPSSLAVVVVLSYRILSFWLPLILGFPLILFLQRRVTKSAAPSTRKK
jgi:uncharacterized protein (TIRG00374 family)